MVKKTSLNEYLLYYSAQAFGVLMRALPLKVALGIGRILGVLAYYFDIRHKSLAYANLKIAFSETKTSNELKKITKNLFQNFGQNLIELFRLPLMKPEDFDKVIKIEGKEHISNALKEGRGVIIIAMHFGSWELASLACALLGSPYKVIVKPQNRFSKLDELLNSYRECGGSVVLSRGLGSREMIKSLKNNEVIAMVVDQGGKEGTLVPFFDRQASLSSGAIRLGLKLGVPLCFSVIIRDNVSQHRLIINKPIELIKTGNVDADVISNLNIITKNMEHYIRQYPSEYMWFYKIWKYSNESTIVVLSDGKIGHLRQSETIAKLIETALHERGIQTKTVTLPVIFKSRLESRLISLLSLLSNSFFSQGRLEFLRKFLTHESFEQLMSMKADFIVSCGSSVSSLNYLLAKDHQAKSISVLKPGMLSFRRFDLIVLPQHDLSSSYRYQDRIIVTKGAPNLITAQYLQQQTHTLLNRFSHLKLRQKIKIGLLLGGDNKNYRLTEYLVKIVIHQIKEAAEAINAEIMVTTSRRTSAQVENLVLRELRRFPRCALSIIPNRVNIPESFGGILGLSDVLVVSGDSVSMISESASSGKNTIVFSVKKKKRALMSSFKHDSFIEKLNEQGYILSCDVYHIKRSICDVIKNKMRTRPINDQETILNGVRKII